MAYAEHVVGCRTLPFQKCRVSYIFICSFSDTQSLRYSYVHFQIHSLLYIHMFILRYTVSYIFICSFSDAQCLIYDRTIPRHRTWPALLTPEHNHQTWRYTARAHSGKHTVHSLRRSLQQMMIPRCTQCSGQKWRGQGTSDGIAQDKHRSHGGDRNTMR